MVSNRDAWPVARGYTGDCVGGVLDDHVRLPVVGHTTAARDIQPEVNQGSGRRELVPNDGRASAGEMLIFFTLR